MRRHDNKKLPELKARENKKREWKAEDKEDEKVSTELNERHFKNPKVLIFEVEDTEKPNWRDMENDFALKYPEIWILYSRADEEKTGHFAICNIWLKEDSL